MGMNYYHEINICNHCGRSDKVHIGKSSIGWTFNFHGFRDAENPYAIPVMFWKTWKMVLLGTENSLIRDEEGKVISFEDFVNLVESKKRAKLNHTIYCREDCPEHAAAHCWLDDDGNSFTDTEFS